MARNTKVKLSELVVNLAKKSGDKEVVSQLRDVELNERRALLMRVRQIEENWDINPR